MAECNISIDKNNLPGVKEVCRDFAVLEDHCLAHNLQEQEIESHLASNVYKSKLVQKDLLVAKKLQEEEDEWAKVQNQKHQTEVELQDVEIAHEIQEQLVRQAEQQRKQEEKDAAIARRLQEKEMKEERKRQKQLEANLEEEYFEDHGAAREPLDLDKHIGHRSISPNRYDSPPPASSHRDYPSDYSTKEDKKVSRYPKHNPVAPRSHTRYPEHYLEAEVGQSRHLDQYPEQQPPSKSKSGDRYQSYDAVQPGRPRTPWEEEPERAVRRKEKPSRPSPPHSPGDRERRRDRQRKEQQDQEWEQRYGREERRDRDYRERPRDRDWERGRGPNWDPDGPRQRDRERARARSRERGLDKEERAHGRERPRDGRGSWEEERDDNDGIGRERRAARGRHRVPSGPGDVFEEEQRREEARERQYWDGGEGGSPSRRHFDSHLMEETGRIVHKGSGAVVAETEYGASDVAKGLTKLDLREQELKDMEVARKIQEEEMKASSMHQRAAQVAQDEEIARLMMEQEKREYKKNREREKEKEREREKEKERERERMAMERMAMERKRLEAEHRPHSEDVVRPRTRDEYELQQQQQRQKNHHKPARPPQPRQHDYENINAGCVYPDHPAPPRAPTRPDAAYKGAYYKR